jgi:hypothetical protein
MQQNIKNRMFLALLFPYQIVAFVLGLLAYLACFVSCIISLLLRY